MNHAERFANLNTPPHSLEAEQSVLAAMIEANWLINDIDVNADDFYRREHQVIYNRLQALAVLGKPVDPVTLASALESAHEIDEAGGIDYLVDILSQSRGPSNAATYAEIIKDRALSRRLVRIGNEIAQLGFDGGSAQEKLDLAQRLVMEVEIQKTDEPQHINPILKNTIDEIDRLYKQGGGLVGIPTGFKDIDDRMSGLQPEDLIIIAGRPGMGKSVFAMNIIESVVQQGKFALVFSLEMSATQLSMRSISSVGGMSYNNLKRGAIQEHEWTSITAGVGKLKDKSLYIDDNANLSSNQIVGRARKIAQRIGKKVDLIVVDYLQLLNDKGEGHERITRISRAMKMAAKELKCTIVLLSQLNRKCEDRPNKRPVMSDLRESGAIEQDADAIIMLYRDEVYDENSSQKGITEAIVKKLRNGEPGTIYLRSDLNHMRFTSLDNYTPQSVVPMKRRSAFEHLD